WGADARSCYDNTIALIADAAHHLNEKLGNKTAFGGPAVSAQSQEARTAAAAKLMPRLRRLVSGTQAKVGHFTATAETLELVCSADFERLAALGTSCPDHFLRTKIAPLTLDAARLDDDAYLAARVAAYRESYAAYYARCARPADPPMRDANPVVILVPGVGQITFA